MVGGLGGVGGGRGWGRLELYDIDVKCRSILILRIDLFMVVFSHFLLFDSSPSF